MKIGDLRALVEQRRSVRGYDESREVPDEVVNAILDCARWAPSGGNGQPWEFIVVRDKETRHRIADYYLKQMEQKREMDLAVRGTAKMTEDGFRHAPCISSFSATLGSKSHTQSGQSWKKRSLIL